MNSIQILFVEPFGQHEGHPPIESRRVTEALAKAGVIITLITFDGVRDNWTENSHIKRQISVTSQVRQPITKMLRFLEKLRRYTLTRFMIDMLETSLTILIANRESRRQEYDAIHFFDGQPPTLFHAFASGLLVKKQNFVINIYSSSPTQELKGGFKEFSRGLKRKDYRYALHLVLIRLISAWPITTMEKHLFLRGFKRNHISFFCHTDELKETYKTYLNGIIYDRLYVIPLGIQPPEESALSQSQLRQRLNLPQGAKILLWFGTNHFGKNLEVIFQAVHNMPKSFYLLFVGKLTESDIVRNPSVLAKKYDWEKNTIVVGEFVSERDKPCYFYASDAIILSHISTLIASASVLNEACQFLLPVICSDSGQSGKWAKNYRLGPVFIAEDPESLHQAIVSALNFTEVERLAVKANFYRFASALSWKEVTERYKALYLRQVPIPFSESEPSKV